MVKVCLHQTNCINHSTQHLTCPGGQNTLPLGITLNPFTPFTLCCQHLIQRLITKRQREGENEKTSINVTNQN